MNPFLDRSFEQYYEASPLTLIDIGASGGVHGRWKPLREHLRVVGFEPDERAFRDLMDTQGPDGAFTYINSALHSTPTEIEFYLTRKHENSSILAPNTKLLESFPDSGRFDVIGSTNIKVTTLDNALRESRIGDVDFIKIDTQGSELFILQGATEILSQSVFGMEVEVEFVDIYREQPFFADVDKFLRGLGLVLFDLNPFYWKREVGEGIGGRKGQIIFADALYFKSHDQLFNPLGCGKSKLLKAISICVVYGYFDYALSICEEALKQNIFSEHEYKLATEKLKRPRHLSVHLPRFRGRNKLAHIFYIFYDILRTHSWAHSGRALGNDSGCVFRG